MAPDQRPQQRRRRTPISLLNLQDLDIEQPFWERLDHALRITMACAFTGSIIFFTDQNVMALGFLGLVVLIVLEPQEQTVGACLRIIPVIYRGATFGALVGLIGAVAIFQPLLKLEDDTPYRVVFPFVATAAAFFIVVFKWIPNPCNGVASVISILLFVDAPADLTLSWKLLLTIVFGISTSVVFKLLPLPTSSLLPTLTSSSAVQEQSGFDVTSISRSNTAKKRSCQMVVVRSAFALPKVRILIYQGRKLATAIIAMLIDLAIAETDRKYGVAKMTSFNEDDEDDDMIVRRHVLASINASLKKLENDVLPKVTKLMNDSQLEIKLLCTGNREEAGHLMDWLDLLQTIVPTLRFLQSIVSVNHWENEIQEALAGGFKEDPLKLQESFAYYLEAPVRSLTRALCASIMNNECDQASVCLQNIDRAYDALLSAVSDLRFDLFYRSDVAGDDLSSEQKSDAAKWGFLARGFSFVHGMSRLVCAISFRSFEATATSHDIESNEFAREPKNEASSKRTSHHSSLNYLRDTVDVFFAGMAWNQPFSSAKNDLHNAVNFGVQIGLATLWYAIPVLNERMNNQGIFVAVTSCFINTGVFGLTFQKSVQRILGTAIASVFAMFVVATLDLSTSQALNSTYPYILLCIMLTDRKSPYTMDCAAFTAAILLFQRPGTEELFLAVTFRIATVGIGVIQFIVVEMIFFRDSARTRVEEQGRIFMTILTRAFDDIAEFAAGLDGERRNVANDEAALEELKLSVSACKKSTTDALADLDAAQHEPGPKIDVKPPFDFENYSQLLEVQSRTNTTLSQLLDCCEAMAESPESDKDKPAYREEVSMLQAMIESVRDPLKKLSKQNASHQEWLRNMRRFKKSAIKNIGSQSFEIMRERTLNLKATDKGVMVDQSFMLPWIAVSRCLLQLCDEFKKMSECYEKIASSNPRFCAFDSLPLPAMLTERTEDTDVERPPATEQGTKDE